jgi:hypothetical protein
MRYSHECADFRQSEWGRRELLRAGYLGFLGLNLPGLFRLEAAQARLAPGKKPKTKLRSCIFIFYYGGPSHQDTWDMKPDAPLEVRGEFRPIATAVPGIRVCEHLSRSARIAHHVTVVRSMHHHMRNHNSAAVEALCGRTPLKGDLELLSSDPTDFPCYGSALSYLFAEKTPMPPYVSLPHVMRNIVKLPGQTAGFLGSAYNAMQIERNPNDAEFRVGEMQLPANLTLGELEHRQSIQRLLDRQARGWEQAADTGVVDGFYRRAFDLLRSPTVGRAFDIAREDPRTRDRYGRNKHGQSLLLARRLIEAGVGFVSVYDGRIQGEDNWDTHTKNFETMKNRLLPPADQAYAALIEDLHLRGLLGSTLVIAMGEFGRTPKVNQYAGRDHWPDCFTVLLAGGGVKGGFVYGSSDQFAAYPERAPVTPADMAATLFWRFGIEPRTWIQDFNGRSYRLAEGEPVSSWFDGSV